MLKAVSGTLLCACLAVSLLGQGTPVIPSGMTAVNLHTIAGQTLGGIVFDPLGSTLNVANYGGGWIESYPVIRDPGTGQITGFGAAAVIASAAVSFISLQASERIAGILSAGFRSEPKPLAKATAAPLSISPRAGG